MKRIRKDPVKEKKENTAYALLLFFVGAFVVKVVLGNLTGSNLLLISGKASLFGVFLAGMTLLKIHIHAKRVRDGKSDFNEEKLEFIFLAGISLLIAIFSGTVLYMAVHLLFYHTLYPPSLLAAWVAVAIAAADWGMICYYKGKIEGLEEADSTQILFLLYWDFTLAIVTVITVLMARSGLFAVDYLMAVLTAVLVVFYSIHLLFRSFRGLMDASCDRLTLAKISRCIKKADPSLRIESLRATVVGRQLDIMTVVGLSRTATVKEAKQVMRKIEHALGVYLSKPHHVHIGFTAKGPTP